MQDSFDLTKLIFGRLSWDAIPFHEPILLATFAGVLVGGAALIGLISYFRLWGTLWRDWITSIDHKKIGIMYMILGLVMFLRGFADALMMRAQQALSFGENAGFLPPHHYDLRGDAVRDGPDELRGAAADRRSRRGFPLPEQFLVLDDDHGRRAGHGLAVRG